MFERILKFLRILIYSKFEFSNPDPKQLIVFDNSDIFSLKQHILNNYNYFVLEDRGHLITKFYFSFKIFKNILVYKKYGIILAYKISLIKAVNPKLILTFIHNSENFSKCAQILKKEYNFLAIQNSSFYYRVREANLLKQKISKDKKLFLPHLLAYSKLDKDNYLLESKVVVKKFDYVGSLRLANFKNRLKKKIFIPKRNNYDICLLSEVGSWELVDKKLDLKFAKLIKFVVKYAIEKNKKIIFALKRQKNIKGNAKQSRYVIRGYYNEQSWYKKHFNKTEYNYLKKNFKYNYPFSSYEAAEESKVVIASMSTMLREFFSQKKKILACNFTSNNVYDFPIKGISSINYDCDYEYFKKRLDRIFKISVKKYFKEVKFKNNYDLNCNKKNQTIQKINIIIKEYLKD